MAQLKLLTFPEAPKARPQRRAAEAASRIREGGAQGASLGELLAAVAGPELAALVENDPRPFRAFLSTDYHALRQKRISDGAAVSFVAAVELARRIARERVPESRLLTQPDDVAAYLTMRYSRSDQEAMGALYLDVRRRLITDEVVFRGTLTRISVEPRQVLRRCLELDAVSFVLFHTHPSGDPAPSLDDLDFTRRVASAAEAVGVELLDHLILGSAGRWVSLKKRQAW